ncbi:MAG: sulfite exporter TauE/SafE family protein [Planctomycetes bacterium]|nr:sulfite exporter TauE/SafE family protein [Planctomycetota bacterium]
MATQYLLIPVVLGLAAMVQGATGFGFGLLALAILGNALNVQFASVMLAVPTLCINGLILWRLRSHFRWSGVAPLLVGVLIGVPLGVAFLIHADPRIFTSLLAVLLIVSSLRDSIPGLHGRPWHSVYVGLPCGIFSGALSGGFGAGGPPLVAFLTSQANEFDRFRFSATLQFLFAVSAVARVVELGRRGIFTKDILIQSGIGTAVAIVGALIGLKGLLHIPNETLRKIVNVFLFAMGIRYLVAVMA